MKTLLALALLLASPSAFACGDKLAQIGRGVRYQRANAVHSASILILIDARLDRQTASRLGRAFTTVGHKVQIVDGAAGMTTALKAKRYDVVVTDNHAAVAIAREVQSSSSPSATVVPVVNRTDGAEAGGSTVSSSPSITIPSREVDQVNVIGQAMKARDAALARARS